MRRALLILLLLLAPIASGAWTLGAGAGISQPENRFVIGPSITVPIDARLVFDGGPRYSPILNGLLIDMEPVSGEWTWTIESWTQANISVSGDNAQAGTMRVSGLEAVTYNVHGVLGQETYSEIGPEFTFDVPAGEQTIYILPATSSDAAIYLDSGFSWVNGSITAVVSLRGIDGGSASGEASNINVSVYLPNGETTYINVTETPTPGVYRGWLNVTTAPTPAPYVVTATFGQLSMGVVVIVNTFPGLDPMTGTISLSTAADTYFPLIEALVWLAIAVFFLYWNGWLPGTAAFAAMANSLLPSPIWPIAASVLLVAVTFGLHALAVNGILPVPWRKKA